MYLWSRQYTALVSYKRGMPPNTKTTTTYQHYFIIYVQNVIVEIVVIALAAMLCLIDWKR